MISVIVPFQKGVHFLKECLQSLAEQTYQDFEIILVYNGVTEDVDSVVVPMKEKLTIKTVTEAQIGVGHARNRGLQEATGEYVYFLDADDYLNVDALELLVTAAEKWNVDLAYGRRVRSWLNRAAYQEIRKEEEEKRVQEKDEEFDRTTASEAEIRAYELRQISKRYFYKKKTIGLITILHTLIRKDYIDKHQFSFDGSLVLASDISFTLPMLCNTEKTVYVSESYYVKRNHTDPIHFPALVQQEHPEKFKNYFDAYDRADKILDQNNPITQMFHRQMATYCAMILMPKVVEEKKKIWKEDYFKRILDILSNMDISELEFEKRYAKKVVKALHKNNASKALRLTKRHQMFERVRLSFKRKNFLKMMIYKRFTKLPIKQNVVFFEAFLGRSYSDSPKYIYEYLAKEFPGKYKFVWSMTKKQKLPYGGKVVYRFGLRYLYYLATSKYFVYNVRQPKWFMKRKGVVFLDTWHGTPLKRLVFDQEDVSCATPLYQQEFYKQSRQWDYLISPNDFCTETFARAFDFEKEKIVPCGYPRNDILYNGNNPEYISSLKKKIGIPEGKKVILYAPTWRDDQHIKAGEYYFDLELDLKMLQERLQDEYVLVLRTHYFIANKIDVRGMENFVINASEYDDIAELYLTTDILITDYSSVFFDYANLRRPMLFFTYDIEKYRDMLRGFYLDMETEVPGPMLYTSEEVVDAIEHIDDVSQKYQTVYDEFYNRFCHIDDGHATQRIVDVVFKGDRK